MSDYPPLTRADLIEAFGLWHDFLTKEDWPALGGWTNFMGERGGEVLALAIAAVGRLGPKEIRGPYGQRMLGQTQHKIVDLLTDDKPRTTTEIAESLGLNYQNTRRMLPVLEARGLIKKSHDPIKAAQVWSSPAGALVPYDEPESAPEVASAPPAEAVKVPKAKRPPPVYSSPEKRLELTPEQRTQEHVEAMRYIHGWDDEASPAPATTGAGK